MFKLVPVIVAVVALCGCTIQGLTSDNPTLDSVEGLSHKVVGYTTATVKGDYIFPANPMFGGAIGGLWQLSGDRALYKGAYEKAKDAVGADALIHYQFETNINWFLVYGWAEVTCTGTGIKY